MNRLHIKKHIRSTSYYKAAANWTGGNNYFLF